jgi:hypothetical protein
LATTAAFYSCPEAIHVRLGKRRCGLLRFGCNDEVKALDATKQPDGQIRKILSSPLLKNIPLSPSGKSLV